MADSPNERIAWITGASSGIGKALALRMARDGWRVAITARSASTLAEVAAEARSLDGSLLPCPADVTDRAGMADILRRIEGELGPVNLAVLNAGSHREVAAASFDADDFRALMELNFLGAVNGIEALLPGMLARGSGRIAIVASVAGYTGLPTAAAYGASKAALINMAEALQPELAAAGVALQIVNPGFVRTPLTDRNSFPMPFLMEPDDAADAFWRGLQSDRFEIVFPRRLAWLLKALKLLPYPLYFAITRRMLRDS
jgi:short-subunit dehydrogenase